MHMMFYSEKIIENIINEKILIINNSLVTT